MDASTSSTVIGDFAVRSSDTNSNSARYNSRNAQKGRRLNNIAAQLQQSDRALSYNTSIQLNGTMNKRSSGGSSTNSGFSKNEQGRVTCHQCLLPVRPASDALACIGCKKKVHPACSGTNTSNNQYVCLPCRKCANMPSTSSSLLASSLEVSEHTSNPSISHSRSEGGSGSPVVSVTPASSSTTSSSSTPVATPLMTNNLNLMTLSVEQVNKMTPPVINTDFDNDQLPKQMPTGSSFTSSIDEDVSMFANSCDMSGASSTASNSAQVSPVLHDCDDGKPSSSRKGAKSRSNDSRKNYVRQTSMKTRSGGAPSNKSYALLEKGVERERRRPATKGKGKGTQSRTRRNRNAKSAPYLQSIAKSIRNSNEEGPEGDEPKTRQPDENDYIRTAVVSSADNQYVCSVPMCLICGSIGRDEEATMMTCMSCAQTYHSYCVNMHAKLNKTICKRGWRCLQCTVCEVCGDGNDESHLLLCDECDVAFHIYCLEPKLDKIPTGSWRCHWCATCRRCNGQVQSGLDLQRLEGLCESCHSQRICPKCQKLYADGDFMIRCQNCSRWLHGACEDLTTEEQLENAYENAFRCSLCRPSGTSGFQDVMNTSVIVDSVMVNKTSLDYFKCGRSGSSLANLDIAGGSFRSQSTDQGNDTDELVSEEIEFATGHRRQKSAGPGRRQPKIGVGGFIVRNRVRTTQSVEDDGGEVEDASAHDNKAAPNCKQKRRPRKPRRHQLEDAYPTVMQQAFWGVKGVDGKTVLEMQIREPRLEESAQNSFYGKQKDIYELSEPASNVLRSQAEYDMLDDFKVEDMDVDLDSLDFNFSEFLDGDDDNFDDDFATLDNTEESSMDATRSDAPTNDNILKENTKSDSKSIAQRHVSEGPERTNQWFEDEPLGDKATKAAVLYANITFPELKTQYPDWSDRKKQITRLWRTLESSKRTEFVTRARENRCGRSRAPRRRDPSSAKPVESGELMVADGTLVAKPLDERALQEEEHKQNHQPSTSLPLNGDAPGASKSTPVNQPVPFNRSGSQQRPNNLSENGQFQQGAVLTNEKDALVPNGVVQFSESIRLRRDQLSIELSRLHEIQHKMEAEMVTLRKLKKNLTAKKRQLNKNPQMDETGQPIVVELAPDDKLKLETTQKTITERSRELDKCKRDVKERQVELDGISRKYGLTAPPSSAQGSQRAHAVMTDFNSSTVMAALDAAKRASAVANGLSSPEAVTQSNFSLSSGFPTHVFVNGGGTLQRANSEANLGQEPGSTSAASRTSTGSIASPVKSTRGRKRKYIIDPTKPVPRTASLGGITYSSLKDDVERQVYDLMDAMLHRVCVTEERSHSLTRLLMTHSASPQSSSVSPDNEAPKKKKRTSTKKPQPPPEGFELEAVVEKIQSELSAITPTTSAFENPLPSFDPAIFSTKDTTKLSDTTQDHPLDCTRFGEVKLSFLSDYFDDFEEHCNKQPVHPHLPVKCSEIYGDVRFDEICLDELENDELIFSEYDNTAFGQDAFLNFRNEVPREDFDQLNIDRMQERAGADVMIPLIGRWPEDEVPIEPPRPASSWLAADPAVDLELVIDQDEEDDPQELLKYLSAILDPNNESINDLEFELENVRVLSPESDTLDELNLDLSCIGCNCVIEGQPFCDPAYDNNVYCSQKCADLHSKEDVVSLDGDKELSLPAAQPLSIVIGNEELDGDEDEDHEFPIVNEFEQGLLLDTLRQSREAEYAIPDLPMPPKPVVDVTPGGSRAFRFRGIGWMLCDEKLVNSFKHPQEDTRDAIKKYCSNSNISSNRDYRTCIMCNMCGDGIPSRTGRLLNVDANEWIHVNCAIWSSEVHESDCGGLNNVQQAIKQSFQTTCTYCSMHGASVKCFKLECENRYHLLCAVQANCKFMRDANVVCFQHSVNIHPDVGVKDFTALRRIYIEREENTLLGKVFNHAYSTDMMMRIGSLVFYHIGQLMPDQVDAFHNAHFIYPIGFRVVRYFWHPTALYERYGYTCYIEDRNHAPSFRVTFEGREFRDTTPQGAWQRILLAVQQNREKNSSVLRFFPNQISGDALFGFMESSITKMLESLPGIDQLNTYEFKHGGMPLMDVPLALNPSGCARAEAFARGAGRFRRRYLGSPIKLFDRPPSENRFRRNKRKQASLITYCNKNTLQMLKASGISEEMVANGFHQFELAPNSLTSQNQRYKEMKNDWQNYVTLGRSRIAGLGLYATRELYMHQMIIEYVGELIRSEVCEVREKMYQKKNMGVYMFRIDSEVVVDATMTGNMARYINHSCDPNCFAEIISVENTKKIVIVAGRPIRAGEELTYDYKFDIEDSTDKIPCLCGAPNCLKWMN